MPRARIHHGARIVTDIPMLPGYIFLCVDDAERSELKRQEERFVQIELQRDAYWENVLIRELNALRQCEALSREVPILVNPDIKTGDKVLITSGSLKGLETDVVRRDDGNNVIIVNITILNQHIEYPVSPEILKRITQ